MSINSYVSDLFFNTDHSNALLPDTDDLPVYNVDILLKNAGDFLNCIQSISGDFSELIPEDLVDDFMIRL